MLHGVQVFYSERARFARRVSLTTLGVALGFLGVFGLLLFPSIRHALHPLHLERFGFEGPDQYVRRILIESIGPLRMDPGPELTMIRQQAMRGGAENRSHSTSPRAEPETRERRFGPGDSPEDLVTMARAIYRSAPVVQSEELVIERLVRPAYPEDARNANLEGKVAVVALVDTTGHVASVDVMASTGQRTFEKAATEAVWECLFRPYKVNGKVQEVYAVFRFAFRMY